MDDLISRQKAIEALGERPLVWMDTDYEIAQQRQYDEDKLAIETVQSTLYGYNIEHLILIAEILRKENLPPERVAEAIMDIDSIVAIVRAEFEESLKKAVERCGI